MYALKRVLPQEILGICVWCQCIKEKEISMSITVMGLYIC